MHLNLTGLLQRWPSRLIPSLFYSPTCPSPPDGIKKRCWWWRIIESHNTRQTCTVYHLRTNRIRLFAVKERSVQKRATSATDTIEWLMPVRLHTARLPHLVYWSPFYHPLSFHPFSYNNNFFKTINYKHVQLYRMFPTQFDSCCCCCAPSVFKT